MMGVPPNCQHGQQAKLYVTRKQGPNFGRTFWRCPQDRQDQCPYFAWTLYQPMWPTEPEPEQLRGVWRSPTRGSASASAPRSPGTTSTASSTSRAPTCPHLKTRKSGSNGKERRVTCVDCGKILLKEKVEKSESENERITKSPALTTQDLEEFAEFQEFRRWQKGQSAGSKSSKK